jgi:hypothetical protein
MKALIAIAAAVVTGGVVLSVASQPKPLAARIGSAPVVVELFTSQGCSSCPPADELLGRIARDPALRGRVIPLAFHVDYWNHLGWRDPFSSHEWSLRQYDYARRFDISGPYTPQAVVDGAREMIGSNEGQVFAAIEAESRRTPVASIAIHGDVVHAVAPRELQLIVLETIAPQTTPVPRGENEGRTLASYAVVRRLTRAGAVRGEVDRRIALPEHAVVLLQDANTLRIEAAAAR